MKTRLSLYIRTKTVIFPKDITSYMNKFIIFAFLAAIFIMSIGITTDAFAHKDQIIGDYKVGVGWKNEPPVEGIPNAIEIVVELTTPSDKESMEKMDHSKHDDSMNGNMTSMQTGNMTSSSDDEQTNTQHQDDTISLDALIKLDGEKTFLTLVEMEKGLYHAQYTPMVMGFPSVDLAGTLGHEDFAVTFHPEKVEPLSILAPLKQLAADIDPQDIMCKDNLTLVFSISERPACVTSNGAAKLIEYGWTATT
jgi:hypothetical protein